MLSQLSLRINRLFVVHNILNHSVQLLLPSFSQFGLSALWLAVFFAQKAKLWSCHENEGQVQQENAIVLSLMSICPNFTSCEQYLKQDRLSMSSRAIVVDCKFIQSKYT